MNAPRTLAGLDVRLCAGLRCQCSRGKGIAHDALEYREVLFAESPCVVWDFVTFTDRFNLGSNLTISWGW